MANLEQPAASSAAKTGAMRLGICEVCARIEARYACPKCEVKTCSLPCVQIHKRELNCDGKRDRTKYLPISEMTAREFMSDYCFLEECTRYAENRKCDPLKRYTHQQKMLPLPQHRMRAAALERGTRLNVLLPNFSRHKENTTYLDWKLNRLFWRVEWLFLNVAGEDCSTPARFVDARCDEQLSMAALLLKYVDLQHAEAREQRKLLANYQSAGIGQLRMFLRAEGVKRSGSRYYELAAHKTLRDNLAGKTIVEFPTIYVSYEQRPNDFVIIESDEEEEVESEEPPTAEQSKVASSASKRRGQQDKQQQKAKKKAKADTEEELHDVYELAATFEEGDDDDISEDGQGDDDVIPSNDEEEE